MRNGTCSKCGKATVHMARNGLRLGGEHGHSVLYPHMEPGFRGMMVGHQTDGLWQFACTTCGYLELHVLDDAALAFIRQRWPVISPR